MPLLRLLHQICNMYQNVKDAQNEFHDQPELSKKSHTKDECSLGRNLKYHNHKSKNKLNFLYRSFGTHRHSAV